MSGIERICFSLSWKARHTSPRYSVTRPRFACILGISLVLWAGSHFLIQGLALGGTWKRNSLRKNSGVFDVLSGKALSAMGPTVDVQGLDLRDSRIVLILCLKSLALYEQMHCLKTLASVTKMCKSSLDAQRVASQPHGAGRKEPIRLLASGLLCAPSWAAIFLM